AGEDGGGAGEAGAGPAGGGGDLAERGPHVVEGDGAGYQKLSHAEHPYPSGSGPCAGRCGAAPPAGAAARSEPPRPAGKTFPSGGPSGAERTDGRPPESECGS